MRFNGFDIVSFLLGPVSNNFVSIKQLVDGLAIILSERIQFQHGGQARLVT